ncbi:MAG: glycoside hydrolase family 2 protein [Cytophagales bacterium]|nr:glycoside hydrolase family 2 protein [Cytophagales bacterium]
MLNETDHKIKVHSETGTNCLRQIDTGWEFRSVGEEQWYPATVPGTNFTDLLDHQLIPDPFDRNNESELQWIEVRNWEYRTSFMLDEVPQTGKLELVFEGLDTYADVYLNGNLILEASNMFVPWRCDVAEHLVPGENELYILFRSPIDEVGEKAQATGILYPAENDHSEENLSVFTRKAPYHFGWDWGPRFVTSGVWRPIWLHIYEQAVIEEIQVNQSLSPRVATVNFDVTLSSEVEQEALLEITCLSDDLDHQGSSIPLSLGQNQLQTSVQIEDYKKWWPRGLGDPYLYEFRLDLIIDETVVSSTVQKVGLRTVETVIEKDAMGQSFFFKVNGVPVYAKGANYIPQDSFLTRVSDEHYHTLLQSAIAANMNIIRVWGGGIYEKDLFYELADEHGLMVWQDFMFACTMYPGDQVFLDSVKQEATANIRRLRNHPSIVMWCGNNEIEMGWDSWGWTEKFNYRPEDLKKLETDYQALFQKLLPELISQLDPGRHYLSSSPMNNWEDPDLFKYGNHHYWGVWHGEAPFEDFKRSVPRFMSEFGFQSFPVQSSVQRYSLPEDWSIDSEVMKVHQKHPRGNQLIATYTNRSYHPPKDFESFLYLSQVVQAEGMRMGIEAQRRSKPFCMGTIYWQLNDCWPVASWSGIDYYGKWKALHYEVARQYTDYLITCDFLEDGTINVHVVSDKVKAVPAGISLIIKDFEGNQLVVENQTITVKPGVSELYFTIEPIAYAHLDTKQILLDARLAVEDNMYTNQYYWHPVKELALPEPDFIYEVSKEGEHWLVTLSATVLVKSMYLEFEGVSGNFSDNFFDLLPYEVKKVRFPREGMEAPPQLKVMSIPDTY